MKKTLFQLLSIVSVLLLFVQCASKGESTAVAEVSVEDSVETEPALKIAYINVDTLLANYEFAKELSEAYLKKTENYRASMNEKVRSFEKEVADFQRKAENNAFLSPQRMQDAQNNLVKKQNALQEEENRISKELLEEQQRINMQLSDTVNTFLQEYNAEKKYEMIISNTAGDNILIAQPKYNITQEVTDLLNQRYVK